MRDARGRPVAVDPGRPGAPGDDRPHRPRLAGPDGLDADGCKVDFTQLGPSGPSLVAHTDTSGDAPVWTVAAVRRLLTTLYTAPKAARPDALVVTHTAHPSFGDVCDMVRLNDVLERAPGQTAVPVADEPAFRSRVVAVTLPGHLVSDQWPMPTRAEWRSYVAAQEGATPRTAQDRSEAR